MHKLDDLFVWPAQELWLLDAVPFDCTILHLHAWYDNEVIHDVNIDSDYQCTDDMEYRKAQYGYEKVNFPGANLAELTQPGKFIRMLTET